MQTQPDIRIGGNRGAVADTAAPANQECNILIVDDRPEQRLALSAILAGLGETTVEAASGRDALRCLLHQDFAVILLDVNMPGMDGFETATLIRQRTNSEHTPIIFVTAYSDDTFAARGYSLGAVDYILAPVQPEILCSKVSVFVDLFKKTEQVRRQAESLRQRAEQLHKLTEASLSINSALSADKILQVVTETAARIIGCHQAAATTSDVQNGGAAHTAVWCSDKYGEQPPSISVSDTLALEDLLQNGKKSVRLSDVQLHSDARPHDLKPLIPSRDWLAARLTGRDGRAIGLVQLSDKAHGEFTVDDEAILVQLAQMASIAMENTIYSEAREANRLKDEFLSTLSHELRTPLQAMLSWTRMLRTGKVDPPTTIRALEVIERSAKAQARLIEDLLDISRIINGKIRLELRPLSLVKVIGAAIDAARPSAAAKDIDLRCTVPAAACPVSADPNRLQQVIGNLLSNALKFTPNGGSIMVTLTADEGQAIVRVSDTGKGIAAEFLPHIFERFRQADSSSTRAYGGLGLGLAIAHHMAQLHGGTLSAESAGEGRGATFTLALPLLTEEFDVQATRAADAGITAPAGPTLNAIRLDGLRIVVVDDEDDTRESVALVLEQCGATVTAVGCATDALAAIDHAVPDVLVCDLGMPDEDGYSLIRKVRARDPKRGGRVPAAALTAYVRSEDRVRALVAGFHTHIPKPVEPAELATIVKSLANQNTK